VNLSNHHILFYICYITHIPMKITISIFKATITPLGFKLAEPFPDGVDVLELDAELDAELDVVVLVFVGVLCDTCKVILDQSAKDTTDFKLSGKI
jgi:hypothetical protein